MTITTWPPRYRCRLSSISAKKYKKTLFFNFESFFQIYSLSVLTILTLIFACFDISCISHVNRAGAEACCVKDRNILLKNGSDVFFLLDDQLLLLKSRNDPLATPEVLASADEGIAGGDWSLEELLDEFDVDELES